MNNYEQFIDYYDWKNIRRCAYKDIKGYKSRGHFFTFLLSFFGYIVLSSSFFMSNIFSILFMLIGFSFFLPYAIFVARDGSSSFETQIHNYLNDKYNDPDWDLFCNYLTSQYVFEDTKSLWRSGFGVGYLSLAVGQVFGYISSKHESINNKLTSYMFQSALVLISALFFYDKLFHRRKTRIHLAIQAIKKFQANRKREVRM